MSFDNLGLAPVLLNAIKKAGFTNPTKVQEQAIPMALEGHDLIVTAQTGSGKTAAFMLPALQKMATQAVPSKEKNPSVQMLVLTPTRELALQVAEAAKVYSAGMKDLRIATVVGGMPYGAQIKALSRRVDILVATPGRLIDHLQAKRVNLSKIHSLVLDEADRMLDMGFIDDIESIVAQTPKSRQTLMFSATFEGSVARLAEEMLDEPQRIMIADQKNKHDNIKQCLLYADDHGHKFRLLDYLLRDSSLEQAIVFTATKRGADDLAERLEDDGFAAAALHGDMNQRQRTRTLNLLQKGRIQVLVATDVAARGIDVQGITHSINYDLPMQPEDYVHRIGRTGRAGRNGLAFTLATHSERFKVRRIEQFIGQTIETDVIPGLEPTPKPVKTKDSKGRG
ncbi:MAG: DEAD/DEAH box helicase, partial [Pelistega sp.]|nr:DEAD/DEAH box helicase [Pelistega sp.]